MNNLLLKKRVELSQREKELVDAFIMKQSTNGEFINSLHFLEYHPNNRFCDDSIVLFDSGSKTVRAVMMAAKKVGVDDIIVSHPGTTFAGPIIDRKMEINEIERIVNQLLDYYEEKYRVIELKLSPIQYATQPIGTLDYILLKRGYKYGMTGLSNIIDLSGIRKEEDILQLFGSKRRNQVRKVIREELFEFKEDNIIRDEVWSFIDKNLREKFQAKATHSLKEIRELRNRFPENIIPYYVDSKDGRYGAFALVFRYKNVFHTQYLDVNYEFTGKYPNLYLIFQLIKEAKGMGDRFFSFGVSTERGGEYLNYGLYHYKAGYGGGDIVMPLYTKDCGR